MSLNRRLLSTIATATLLTAAPALAKDAEPVHRLSVQGYMGLNLFLPYFGAQLGYRLPTLGDRLEVYGAYEPVIASITAPLNGGRLGARYYWAATTGSFQPFALASLGAYFYMPSLIPGSPAQPSFGFVQPSVGVGFDWMPWSYVGLSASLSAGYPVPLQPQVALRLAF